MQTKKAGLVIALLLITKLIDAAKKRIDLNSYLLTDHVVVGALA